MQAVESGGKDTIEQGGVQQIERNQRSNAIDAIEGRVVLYIISYRQ